MSMRNKYSQTIRSCDRPDGTHCHMTRCWLWRKTWTVLRYLLIKQHCSERPPDVASDLLVISQSVTSIQTMQSRVLIFFGYHTVMSLRLNCETLSFATKTLTYANDGIIALRLESTSSRSANVMPHIQRAVDMLIQVVTFNFRGVFPYVEYLGGVRSGILCCECHSEKARVWFVILVQMTSPNQSSDGFVMRALINFCRPLENSHAEFWGFSNGGCQSLSPMSVGLTFVDVAFPLTLTAMFRTKPQIWSLKTYSHLVDFMRETVGSNFTFGCVAMENFLEKQFITFQVPTNICKPRQ
jgi:hypothetical protein